MFWEELFGTQKQLDEHIQTNHQLNKEDLFEKKVLALLVEVGELANETRCFKFWSQKPQSGQSVILEEYVDGLHFILSLGLDTKLRFSASSVWKKTGQDVTQLFHLVFEQIIAFKQESSKEKYEQLFITYLQLGASLGFGEKEIQEAYHHKNQVNHTRQDQGY
ncbi:dUTP diphosphatase [Sediminibacillus albus]|uniref:Dimeric dUTPase, all-alpha-NTP-PPase (MazG) superfamily n=1 Tax=Sediminibacillus albus TaxID=407036 RepID=A0A1G9BTL5_9BACI|nr:dUTP diphosphatase [Sediminibacillus albus]SDK42325.1 Dimeric dUTPase, all-alpha-NTP-PPase (MazG) superfamily [Sediminibacillus albus]